MKTFIISIKIFLFFTFLTGVIYPLIITGIAQIIYPEKANGSLIKVNSKIIGSKLIGQQFDSSIYFSSRPSAISYNPLPSGGSNYGLTNNKLLNLLKERKKNFISFNLLDSLTTIPSEMLFASGSGLDPHISPKAAQLQINRIVKYRNLNDTQKNQLINLVNSEIEHPQFNILGENRINIMLLNIKTNSLFNK